MATIADLWLRSDHPLNKQNIFIAGIECEIECIGSKKNTGIFRATEDGSLRNDGVEYISEPTTRPNLVHEFRNLHATIDNYDRSKCFSPRTSTHVHVNCRPFTMEQVKNLVLLYALFEEFFFTMVSKDRRHNIHCVPLTETFLPNLYRRDLGSMVEGWHKYTAFNLLPLVKQGSVEFRHLQGTDDPVLLDQWLTCLEQLWLLARDTTVTAEALTDTSLLQRWWQSIFDHCPQIMALNPAFPTMIANPLMDVKFAFLEK